MTRISINYVISSKMPSGTSNAGATSLAVTQKMPLVSWLPSKTAVLPSGPISHDYTI